MDVSSPSQTLTIGEGRSGTFNVRLSRPPTANVTVSVSKTNRYVTVSPTSLTFKSSNWRTDQTITVDAGEDDDATNDTDTITLSASGGGFNDVPNVTKSISIGDNDTAEFLLKPTSSSLTMTEGEQTTFEVRPAARPSANITVSLSVSGSSITLNPTTLRFDQWGQDNPWNGYLEVTVSAPHDDDRDNESSTITLTGSGGDYQGKTKSISVAITDDDTSLALGPQGTLEINEGGWKQLTVSLLSAPSGDVTVSISSSSTALTPFPASLIFSSSDWNVPQNSIIRAAEDDDSANDSATITVSASGRGFDSPNATKSVSIIDNDTPHLDLSTTKVSVTEGGQATFQVKLKTQPSFASLPRIVYVDLTPSSGVAVDTDPNTTGNQTTLTFDSTRLWNVYQTVTVSGLQDDDRDDENLNITLRARGGDYGSATGNVLVSVTDDDKPSGTIQIEPTGDLTIEEGGSGILKVSLSATPDSNVTVSLSKTNDDITLSSTSLTFTSSDFATMQEVTVTAAEDADTDDDTGTVTLSAQGGIEAPSVTKTVSITDNDEPTPTGTIVLSSTEALTINEGGSGNFDVRLSTAPDANVTVSLSKTNDDITLSPTSLTFTSSDFANTQQVTVNAAEDADTDDDTDTITLAATGGIVAPSVTKAVSVTDNDEEPAPEGNIVLSDTETLTIDEGGSQTFTVRLSTAPDDDVSVSLSKTNDDITLSPASLTFTASDWQTPKTVTVTAAQDADAEDDSDSITLSASGGIDADDVTKAISVTDDEVLGNIVLNPTETLTVNEGSNGTFTVRLSAAPSADVTVSLSKNDDDITLSPASLTFTSSDWERPKTVTVSAAQDADAEDESDTITLSAAGGGFIASPVTKAVSVDDDEVLGTIVLDSTETLEIEEGGSKMFTVRLSAAPSADVTVSLSKTNDDITLSLSSLTFTTSDWETPKTVTVSAAQDEDAESESDTITLTATGGIIAEDVTKSVRIADDEAPQGTILTSPGTLSLNEGDSGRFTVELSSSPTENNNVTVSLSPTDADALTLDKTSLTFTASDWNTPQTVIVTAAHDPDTDPGSHTLTLSASGGIDAPDVIMSVSVIDDDRAGGLSLSPSGTLELVEGGSVNLGVSLTQKPSVASIEVSLSKTDSILTLEPASLTFTDSNWNQPQAVTVSAAEDEDVEDGSDTITLTFTGGGNYASVPDQSVQVRILDSPGELTLTPTELNLTEGGDPVDLQVRLDTQPVNTLIVTVNLTAGRSGLALDPPILVFPADRWDTPRSVAVRAINDSNTIDERTTITVTAVGGNYRSVQRTATVRVQDDDEQSVALPPVKTQALAFPPVGAQDSATMRLRCKQASPCDVIFDCSAQADGSTFEGTLPEPIPAWGTQTLTAEDIERYTGASWAGKGRLGCALRSEAKLGSQVWTRSGDGVLVNNSAFIPSVPEGDEHRADIESIPEPEGAEKTNLRIRCIAPEGSDCTAVRLACYDDEGTRHDGDIGTIERLQVRHIQTMEIAERIDHSWQGMGLACEMRSSAPFTVQVLTRTGGGGALVNNSATGEQ